MGLIELIVYIAVIGMIVYFVTTLIPMPAVFKTVIVAVACLVVLLIVLRALGVDVAVPRLR